MNSINIDTLKSIGGQEWTRDDKRRVYFNNLAELFGLDAAFYNTGNVSSASLHGEDISNTRAREIISALRMSKVWWDAADSQFHYKMHSCRTFGAEEMAQIIISEIKRLAVAQ